MDFWAHAAIGRWIIEHHQVPEQSLWIWGAPPIHWVAHSWGTQVIFATLMRAGALWGPWLAVVLTTVCAVLSFGLLWRETLRNLARQNLRPDIVLLSLYALAIMCAGARFKPRPELFTALFVVFQLLFWLGWPRRPKGMEAPACVALVLMWVLWANIHGAWAFGLALWAITLAGEGAQGVWEQRHGATRSNLGAAMGARWCKLLLVGLCCAGATLLNPYGAEVWASLKSVNSSTFSQIEEWKKPWEWPALPPEWIWGEFILGAGALAAWIYDPKRRWSHLGWILFALVVFCKARRHLWLSALVDMAVLAHSAGALQRPWWLAMRNNARVRLALDASALALMAMVLAFQTPNDLLRMRATPPSVPVRLSRELKRLDRAQFAGRGRTMRPFNDYEYSSYFQWAFGGRPPLFIDLLNAYPDRLMDDYFAVLRQNARGKALLARANVVIMRRSFPGERMFLMQQGLDKNRRQWKRVYRAKDGSIWLRR